MWKKRQYLFYITVVFGLCLIPLAGLITAGPEESSENRTLTEFPGLLDADGTGNENWLADAGDWFQEHFAFRNELVTANAKLEAAVFGVSADDGVITGTDGWLYYADSLEDYLGTELLPERELFNIAHSLALMQEYAQSRGISFLFAAVPNKNTLYGSHMPYYDSYRVSDTSNLKRLLPFLEQEQVSYLNLQELFADSEKVLYHKTDSHWTNEGAAMAAEAILDALGREHTVWSELAYEERNDFVGDLARMLYPAGTEPEPEYYYEYEFPYHYEGEVSSTFDPKIRTEHTAADGSVVVYRDSFGNALLPFLADAWGAGYFSRTEPFAFSDLETYGADTVVVERVERFLPNLAKNAAVMDAPVRQPDQDRMVYAGTCQYVEENFLGERCCIEGILAPEILNELPEGAERARICVTVDGQTYYEAFPVTVEAEGGRNAYGYRAYLPVESLGERVGVAEIFCGTEEAVCAEAPEADDASEPVYG